MAELRRYKAINFDLDTQSLRDRFGESGRSKAYYVEGVRYVTVRAGCGLDP